MVLTQDVSTMNKLIEKKHTYAKNYYTIGVEIGDKIYWATIEDESDDFGTYMSVEEIKDDFDNVINVSDEILDEIIEAYQES